MTTCHCMTENPGDGYGERVVTHFGGCPLHPDFEETQTLRRAKGDVKSVGCPRCLAPPGRKCNVGLYFSRPAKRSHHERYEAARKSQEQT